MLKRNLFAFVVKSLVPPIRLRLMALYKCALILIRFVSGCQLLSSVSV